MSRGRVPTVPIGVSPLDDETLRQRARSGPHKYALPHALSELDAGLWYFFQFHLRIYGFEPVREGTTFGSVTYRLEGEGRNGGIIHLREVSSHPTEPITGISVSSGSPYYDDTPFEQRELIEGMLIYVMDQFVAWFHHDALEAVTVAKQFWEKYDQEPTKQSNEPQTSGTTQTIVKPSDAVLHPTRRGPKPDPHNAWAREQARLGRSIDDMLDEYIERRGDNPANNGVRRRAREALRKTIERGSS